MVRTVAMVMTILLGACGDDASPAGGTDAGGMAGGGMCDNDSDRAALQRTYDPGMREVPAVARDCAIDVCLSAPEEMAEQCMNDCITDMTDLSNACATCVTRSVGCVRDNCLSRCLGDPDGADCLACQCGDNAMGIDCREEYNACSGVPSDDCAGM
jgi:hypothetical protein